MRFIMKIFIYSLLIVSIFISSVGLSQEPSQQNLKLYQTKIKLAQDLDLYNKPINQVIEAIAKSFMNTPYEANTLDKPGKESLVIHLTGLDCTTFVENVLALAINIKKKGDFEDYTKTLQKIRYRDGVIKNYTSRLHYFSDWIFDNQKKKTIKDISHEIGGEPIQFQVNFMSQHPEDYSVLKAQPECVPMIFKQELGINKRNYFYIPKARFEKNSTAIQSGDLLAITTHKKGLDIAHVGIAIRVADRKIYLLHASSQGKKVEVTKFPLSQYLENIATDTGVIVLRPLEPSLSDFFKPKTT